jgi:Arf-GAP with SH3 domain, ANK repeat and PH domain-containing protein
MEPIDLRMASVRMARDAERRFCFEVITPQYKRVYQGTSEEDMSSWITAINNALQSAVESGVQAAPQRATSSSPGRDIGSVLTGKSSSQSGPHGYTPKSDANGVNRRITVGARPSYVRTTSNSYDENPSKLLEQIKSVDQGNAWCADCGSSSKVEWVSINLGVILCIECSGIHRSLGTHISKVRSLTLDTLSFTTDIVEILLQIGNRVSNMIWEATLDRVQKLSVHSTREQRLQFITAKYAERAFVRPISPSTSRFATADETLLASIKTNDIQGVLYGIALRGNVNAGDRSRGTHAVFLALAAADPAFPGSTGPSPSASPNNKPATSNSNPMPFPVAELLIQNGAEVPVQLPAIPLSAAAKLYLEQRTARTTGLGHGRDDALGPLPTVSRAIGGGSLFSGSTDREKGESKLQKRGSAGSRLAGKVASLATDRT